MSVMEELQNIRKALEEESRLLNEEQHDLENKAVILREKASIEDLRKSNMATKDAITRLKAEISELEQRLQGSMDTSASCQKSDEAISENIVPSTNEVTIVEQQSDTIIEQHPGDKEQNEKKRRFW